MDPLNFRAAAAYLRDIREGRVDWLAATPEAQNCAAICAQLTEQIAHSYHLPYSVRWQAHAAVIDITHTWDGRPVACENLCEPAEHVLNHIFGFRSTDHSHTLTALVEHALMRPSTGLYDLKFAATINVSDYIAYRITGLQTPLSVVLCYESTDAYLNLTQTDLTPTKRAGLSAGISSQIYRTLRAALRGTGSLSLWLNYDRYVLSFFTRPTHLDSFIALDPERCTSVRELTNLLRLAANGVELPPAEEVYTAPQFRAAWRLLPKRSRTLIYEAFEHTEHHTVKCWFLDERTSQFVAMRAPTRRAIAHELHLLTQEAEALHNRIGDLRAIKASI